MSQKKDSGKTDDKEGTKVKSAFNKGPRKQINQPAGKLSTNNIGIKETLNPTIRKSANAKENVETDQKEDFTFEELERVWKEYSLMVKRNKKNSLYSVLVESKMRMTSDYQIHLELVSTTQKNEIESERIELLGFIRNKLKNFSIGLHYEIIESQKVQILDSKGIFDKLVEENSSLGKFRKLFNLDIEF